MMAMRRSASPGLMGLAGVEGAGYNVRINLSSLKDTATVETLRSQAEEVTREAREVAEEIRTTVESKL